MMEITPLNSPHPILPDNHLEARKFFLDGGSISIKKEVVKRLKSTARLLLPL